MSIVQQLLLDHGANRLSPTYQGGYTALHLTASRVFCRNLVEHDYWQARIGKKVDLKVSVKLLHAESDAGEIAYTRAANALACSDMNPSTRKQIEDLVEYTGSWLCARIALPSESVDRDRLHLELSSTLNPHLSHFQRFLAERLF